MPFLAPFVEQSNHVDSGRLGIFNHFTPEFDEKRSILNGRIVEDGNSLMLYQSLVNNLSTERIEKIAEQNKDYAQVTGICMRLGDQKHKSDLVQILPTTLVPSKMPEKLFRQAYDVQKDISLLYHRVACDYEFVKSTLARVMETDEYTKHLFDIYTEVYGEKRNMQKNFLTIMRSDYMFHQKSDEELVLRQVEVNTIAAGGAGLGINVTRMHRFMIDQSWYSTPDQAKRIPDNQALRNVCNGLCEAWRAYGINDGVILVVVEDLNMNIADQRFVEYETVRAIESHAVVRRATLTECYEKLHLKEFKLIWNEDNAEVAVVYFRSGYSPAHYKTEREWQARTMIEWSRAIKCPWIGAQLAGTKKVQQMLTKPNVLNKFLNDPEAEKRISDTFAKLYSLDADDPETDTVVKLACRSPEHFVLKPQLEGGGNNLYGSAIPEMLKRLSQKEREAFILMERLRPLQQDNILVRADEPLVVKKMDSELGIFGYLLGSADHVIKQEQFGHMIRTKPSTSNEGGISTGAAGHDSPFLV